MDKTKIVIVFIVAFLSGCVNRHSYNPEKYDMSFRRVPWIAIDFDSGVIKFDSQGILVTDTLIFSEQEIFEIKEAFNRAKISDIDGKVSYKSENLIFPALEWTVEVYSNNRLQSQLVISDLYNRESEDILDKNNDIIHFRDVFSGIIESKEKFRNIRKN